MQENLWHFEIDNSCEAENYSFFLCVCVFDVYDVSLWRSDICWYELQPLQPRLQRSWKNTRAASFCAKRRRLLEMLKDDVGKLGRNDDSVFNRQDRQSGKEKKKPRRGIYSHRYRGEAGWQDQVRRVKWDTAGNNHVRQRVVKAGRKEGRKQIKKTEMKI